MSRYIDADKILLVLSRWAGAIPFGLVKWLEAESIDIVRCVECKHRNNRGKCPMRVFTGDNGFCSYGERKSDETD